jgi:hypothetical protein
MDSASIRIWKEWFTRRVDFAWGIDKTRVVEGRLMLGAWGHDDNPASAIGFLAHEMAHLVEIDDRRATVDNFGLRYKRVMRLPPTRYSTGIYADPMTTQGVERECRVIAISMRILGAIGWSEHAQHEDSERTIHALRILMDWYNIPSRRNDEARREWCRKKVARALQQWSVERVRAEWWRKVVLVTKRLERAERRVR